MGYALAPLAIFFMYFGAQMLEQQTANSVQGAGIVGAMTSAAQVAAQQAEMWGTACALSAAEDVGAISAAIPVSLPAGVNAPSNAGCITTAAASDGRNVYAYVPAPKGTAGKVFSGTNMSYTWYRVKAAGEAVSLADGTILAVPTAIPVGDLVEYDLTSN
jgi:hypothetical protein